jgi:hypothetical protein
MKAENPGRSSFYISDIIRKAGLWKVRDEAWMSLNRNKSLLQLDTGDWPTADPEQQALMIKDDGKKRLMIAFHTEPGTQKDVDASDQLTDGNVANEAPDRGPDEQEAADRLREYFEANALAIDGVQWISIVDSHTTPQCRALDSCIWTFPDFKPVHHSYKFPGYPPIRWNCRSTLLPIMKGFTPAVSASAREFRTELIKDWTVHQ